MNPQPLVVRLLTNKACKHQWGLGVENSTTFSSLPTPSYLQTLSLHRLCKPQQSQTTINLSINQLSTRKIQYPQCPGRNVSGSQLDFILRENSHMTLPHPSGLVQKNSLQQATTLIQSTLPLVILPDQEINVSKSWKRSRKKKLRVS